MQAGDVDAALALFDAFAFVILCAIRKRMTHAVRSGFDSVDFLQVTRIKLQRCELEGKHFEDMRAFIAYVVRIAQREVQQVQRKHRIPQKPLDDLSPTETQKLVDRASSPLSADVRCEMIETALAQITPAEHRIIRMISEGYKHKEVAAELGISERTVRRAVHAFAQAWKKINADDED